MSAAITIHFRKPELTAACIDSLLADGWAPVLVWDNSADEGATLRVLEGRYAGDARIHLVRNTTNLGFGGGMNAALVELGRFGYAGPVLLVNNDATVIEGMQAALHAALPEQGVPALVAPRINQNGQEQGWLYYHPWFALMTQQPLPGSVGYLSGCCLLVQRADNTAPLFDEDFFMYGEDVELSWRIRRQGGMLVLLDRAWLMHQGSASSGQGSEAYERFLTQSHWLLARKLATGAWRGKLMLATKLPALFARALLRCLRYGTLVPLRALVYLLAPSRMLPSHHKARR